MTDPRFPPKPEASSAERPPRSRYESLTSVSPAMWRLFEQCDSLAPTEATVLITGETGTGKELLARAVHRRSGRVGRFVPVDCAAISAELLVSELFGHEKGAYTGAVRSSRGLVRAADRGTLFLDEIGDLDAEAQQSLLRLLQEKVVRPVGSSKEVAVDVRIVAATHVALDQAVAAGRFREDLFYRLDVLRLEVPPLRERPEDIVLLFGHFLRRVAKRYRLRAPICSDRFLEALVAYEWPGNARQLENFAERLVLARPQRALTERDFDDLAAPRTATSSTSESEPANARPESPSSVTTPRREGGSIPALDRLDPDLPLTEQLEQRTAAVEADYFAVLLERHRGRIDAVAQQAGISRRTLSRKLKRLGLDKRDFRTTESR